MLEGTPLLPGAARSALHGRGHLVGENLALRRRLGVVQRRARRRVLWAWGVVFLVLVAPTSGADGRQPADAMAFIRLLGDVRAEFIGIWRQPIEEDNVEFATGSGFVIAPSGLILTNHHVVDETPVVRRVGRHEAEFRLENRRIEVALGTEGTLGVYEAWVVAADPELDLAVLQVTASELPCIPFGDSDATEAGRSVSVLGFPFGRKAAVGKRDEGAAVPRPTVTAGSLSAARADDAGATRYLQTSAAVHPGSSGGPMVDEDGYAVGVVRLKLSRGATGQGAGFAVPINLVKDFLESHGLLHQLPVERLYPGVVHGLDWKRVSVELPDGFADTSPTRLLVDTGDTGEGLSLRLVRVATPWDLSELEAALLGGEAWPGFAPGAASGQGGSKGGRKRLLGSAGGDGPDGRAFRVDYALLDLGPEKIVARYVGPPDAVAFNLSLLRRSLETLEARPLLTDEVEAPLRAPFESVVYPGGAAGSVVLPTEWSREPASYASCSRVPVAEAGVAASPDGDFTVVLRALRWTEGAIRPAEVAQACGAAPGSGDPGYGGRFERLGVTLGAWATFVERPGEVLLLEVEAPQAKLVLVEDLYVEWLRRVAE